MNRRELLQTSAMALAATALPNIALAKEPVLNDHADVSRTNWSKNLRYGTDRVYAPANAEEAREVVLQSARIKQLGSQHCFNNIADSHHAQVSLRNLKGIEIDHAAKTATVGAGVRYGELAPVLDKAGFALHNLASLPHISVGGTIATATHGSGVGNKNLSTAVRAIEMITADGKAVTLTREKDGDQFRMAVVHLGALGVLTRVTLDLLPRFDMSQVVYQNLSFDQLEHNLDAIMGAAYSVSLFTDWQGNKASEVWIKDKVVTGATQKTLAPQFYGATLQTKKLHPIVGNNAEACTDQMGTIGPWYLRMPHFKMEFTPSNGEELQTEYFVDRKDGYRAIRAVEQLRDQITPHLFITELRTIAADDLPMSMAYHRDSLAIHFTWKPEEVVVRKLLPQIEAALMPFGARPHWGKIFEMPANYLQAQYPAMAQFRQMATKLDPTGKFRNDYLNRNIFTV
ncbi:MAG: D-arabinono-1,4-lactone oxidase [Janthinobacterium lividum]